MTSSPSPRGRPRDDRSHAAILAATAELVREVGYTAMSISAVAARARVGKDTIYRRWSGKPELVYEAVFTTTDTAPVPDTGTLQGDLISITAGLVEEFSSPAAVAALPGLLADITATPELRDRLLSAFLAPAKARLLVVFDRAQAQGETGGDVPVELVLDMLVGTVLLHLGVLGQPSDALLASHIATTIAKGIEVR
ncbi:TetR/AcrR family transcriptional regulator [Salinispora oceanensis]|uniref:TetR/AcrR family transcriptional regulator n=1 Tax=Salinispora oceanensis TaxID=1050199 RepID=UPI00036197FF|nr:TetR/AcrR family transcriptional regulator [Salinispora oceanensis]